MWQYSVGCNAVFKRELLHVYSILYVYSFHQLSATQNVVYKLMLVLGLFGTSLK